MNTQEKMTIKYKMYSKIDLLSNLEKQEIADFLFEHLDEYGDPKKHILNAIEYAVGDNPAYGGFILVGREENEIAGVVVMNKTNMSGYIPENILVYIAVDSKHRGKGIGGELMRRSLDLAKGDVALHVEEDNPARRLYERVGFTNPYLEMRYKKPK